MKINKIFIVLLLIVIVLASCENQTISYPDFDYQTVYFANQFPVRTLQLGDDLFVDTSIDNQHKVAIKATMGGVYNNTTDRVISFKVENSLCDGLYFENNTKVVPMPADYYKLASDKIVIPSGSIMGGVEVQLTDAFFADPQTINRTYVIPLLMTAVAGADSILQGAPLVENPNRCLSDNWSIQPKDFVLYAVKYVNPWHGNYLRRGVDQRTMANGTTDTHIRHNKYVENDELVAISTKSLNESILPLAIRDNAGNAVNFNLVLRFSQDGTCTVSSNADAYDITGTGKFVSKGEKQSMGGYDRDALYLDYSVNFKNLNVQYATKDTLVVRDRGVAPEYFTVTLQ
jgi:hypothetical protein